MGADEATAIDPPLDEARLRQLVDELDRLVPAQGACVLLEPYGGAPDEGRFVGNRTGYLRFGLAILRQGLRSPEPGAGTHEASAALAGVLHEDSPLRFDEFVIDPRLAHERSLPGAGSRGSGLLWGLGCIAAIFLMATLATIGLIAVLQYLM